MNALLMAVLIQAADYQVGAAKENITPTEPILLAGWKGRNQPIGDVAQQLFARAVALRDKAGKTALVVSVDCIGFGAGYSDIIAKRVESLGVPRERFALCSTHCHFSPHVAGWTNYKWPAANAEQRAVIDRYTLLVSDRIVRACAAAMKGLAPARLSFGRGTATFARNRRNETVVDHDLPVLRMQAPDDKVRALVFAYACHCVTADRSKISGDWAGLAAELLEKEHPGAVAVSLIGCAGDQDSQQSTQQCADAVLKGATAVKDFRPIRGALHGKFVRLELPYQQAGVKGFSYPVQTLGFGEDLTLIFLAGEVTVDYSLRLKRELDREKIVVVAYANEVAGYIPSLRVLNAGGYEAEGANVGAYGHPSKFGQTVEEIIIAQVRSLVSPKSPRTLKKQGGVR